MTRTPQRVALVTGGGRGLGLGIAEQLAADGFALAIHGRRPLQAVAASLERLQGLGTTVSYCQADIADRDDRQQLMDQIGESYGRLDVLVNNFVVGQAGAVPAERADILYASEASFDRLIDNSLKGPYFLTQLVANWMIKQRQADSHFAGVLVNVAPTHADLALIDRGEYRIPGAGASMATRLWAVRLVEYGIDVYEVRHGNFHTEMTGVVQENFDSVPAGGRTLEPRWADPAELGRAVKLLVGGELSHATGSVLTVDGGMSLPRL